MLLVVFLLAKLCFTPKSPAYRQAGLKGAVVGVFMGLKARAKNWHRAASRKHLSLTRNDLGGCVKNRVERVEMLNHCLSIASLI